MCHVATRDSIHNLIKLKLLEPDDAVSFIWMSLYEWNDVSMDRAICGDNMENMVVDAIQNNYYIIKSIAELTLCRPLWK